MEWDKILYYENYTRDELVDALIERDNEVDDLKTEVAILKYRLGEKHESEINS